MTSKAFMKKHNLKPIKTVEELKRALKRTTVFYQFFFNPEECLRYSIIDGYLKYYSNTLNLWLVSSYDINDLEIFLNVCKDCLYYQVKKRKPIIK